VGVQVDINQSTSQGSNIGTQLQVVHQDDGSDEGNDSSTENIEDESGYISDVDPSHPDYAMLKRLKRRVQESKLN
jgi:hypothetical protein